MHKLISKKMMLLSGLALIATTVVMASSVGAVGTSNLILHGSTTLGPTMVAAVTPFNNASLGATIDGANILQNSSGTGIGDLLAGTCDVAMSSRPLKTSGTETGATAYAIERDAVIMMVSDAQTPSYITQLSKIQARGIYEGIYADASGNTYWDAGAVTTPAGGIAGNDLAGDTTTPYEPSVSYPALPGNGHSDGHVLINIFARNLDSGTRGFVGDSAVNGGAVFAKASTIITGHADASNYPLEQKYLGDDSSSHREAGAGAMQTAINSATNSALGYAGLGYTRDSTHTNIRDLLLVNDSNGLAYPASNINVYSGHYTFSRFCYLVTKNNNPNNSNAMILVNWMQTLDGAGQDCTITAKELRLVPDEDVNHDGKVDIFDLTQAGNDYSHSGAAHFTRSDVNRDGHVDIFDMTDLGNWYGTTIVQP